MPASYAANSTDYAGRLTLDEVAQVLANAVGGRGSGRDYLANTVRHLEELGIRDGSLHRIAARVFAGPDPVLPSPARREP